MDNLQVDVTSSGRETLLLVLRLFRHANVTGYRIDGSRLVLYWYESSRATPLPFKMGVEQASDFVWAWLEQTDFGPEPDHDGSNSRGWRVYCESWGHVDGESAAFAAIEPVWAMHGK